MRRRAIWGLLVAGLILVLLNYPGPAAAADEFPQQNAYFQASPSVVWCGDPESTTTLEVHIVGRSDVVRVWLVDDVSNEDAEGGIELFDDGTHGDPLAGDGSFTLAEAVIPCEVDRFFYHGWRNTWIFLRVELSSGEIIGNNYGFVLGLVDPKYKGAFEIADLAPGLSATAYSFFIEDTAHQVIDDYPVSEVYCGTTNFEAYRKLYSVFGDEFDFAAIMPGMQIFQPGNLAENVPYNVLVSNQVQHIGVDLMDNTAAFGSAGRLKSVTYQSFGTIAIFDHEIAHTWGAAIGQSLGLLSPRYNYDVNQGHWNENADMEGQLGAFYFDTSGAVGHFSYRGDEIWRLIPNYEAEPYSPLELYVMGLIPPEEVPPVHILNNPDTSLPTSITASSYRTVTIEEIMAAEGGPRSPNNLESQKDFTLAFIVTQDQPYNEAAYAFFSLISYQLTSREGISEYNRSLAPFYWATGGRATIETLLPLDLDVLVLPDKPFGLGEPPGEKPPADAPEEEMNVATEAVPPPLAEEAGEEVNASGEQRSPGCTLLPVGVLIIPAVIARARKKRAR